MNKLELYTRLKVAEKEMEDFITHVQNQPNQDEVMNEADQKRCTELLNNIEELIKLT